MTASLFEVLLAQGKSIVTEISDNIENRGVKASGKTQKSLRYVVEETDTGAALTVYGAKHIQALEDGRGPTRKGGQGGQSLVQVIRQWIDDKGIVPTGKLKSKDSLAFAIAASIHKQGTNLYRSGGHSGVLSDVINNERVEILGEALRKAGLEDIQNQIREDIINVNRNTAT